MLCLVDEEAIEEENTEPFSSYCCILVEQSRFDRRLSQKANFFIQTFKISISSLCSCTFINLSIFLLPTFVHNLFVFKQGEPLS